LTSIEEFITSQNTKYRLTAQLDWQQNELRLDGGILKIEGGDIFSRYQDFKELEQKFPNGCYNAFVNKCENQANCVRLNQLCLPKNFSGRPKFSKHAGKSNEYVIKSFESGLFCFFEVDFREDWHAYKKKRTRHPKGEKEVDNQALNSWEVTFEKEII
jgi:hypothetical protein